MKNGLLSNDLPTGEVYGRNGVSVLPKKRVEGSYGISTTVTVAAVSVTFLADVPRADLASIQGD